MRFEVSAAFAVGVLLPLAEIARRRTNFSPLFACVDDRFAGALRLGAAIKGAVFLPAMAAPLRAVRAAAGGAVHARG